MTSVNLANLGVQRSVWTPEITPVVANLAKQNISEYKNWKTRRKDFSFVNFENPLYFFKVKIAKEKVVLDKNGFGEMFLKFNFTWKYTWSEILKTVKEFILRLSA